MCFGHFTSSLQSRFPHLLSRNNATICQEVSLYEFSAVSRIFIGGIILEDREIVSLILSQAKGQHACLLSIIKGSGSPSSGSSPVIQPLHG